MTRTYAMRKLLEHGPLTFAQMLEITGWPQWGLERALELLELKGHICRFHERGVHRNIYRVVE